MEIYWSWPFEFEPLLCCRYYGDYIGRLVRMFGRGLVYGQRRKSLITANRSARNTSSPVIDGRRWRRPSEWTYDLQAAACH